MRARIDYDLSIHYSDSAFLCTIEAFISITARPIESVLSLNTVNDHNKSKKENKNRLLYFISLIINLVVWCNSSHARLKAWHS